jgi:hypothetical protein
MNADRIGGFPVERAPVTEVHSAAPKAQNQAQARSTPSVLGQLDGGACEGG